MDSSREKELDQKLIIDFLGHRLSALRGNRVIQLGCTSLFHCTLSFPRSLSLSVLPREFYKWQSHRDGAAWYHKKG